VIVCCSATPELDHAGLAGGKRRRLTSDRAGDAGAEAGEPVDGEQVIEHPLGGASVAGLDAAVELPARVLRGEIGDQHQHRRVLSDVLEQGAECIGDRGHGQRT
jgi:hypothetical protein